MRWKWVDTTSNSSSSSSSILCSVLFSNSFQLHRLCGVEWKVGCECWTVKYVEKAVVVCFHAIYHTCLERLRKTIKSSMRTVGVPAKNRTRYLRNKKQAC
jgi:hypothetical protein